MSKHIDFYHQRLSVEQVIVVMQLEKEGCWVPHGEAISVDERWDNGMVVDAYATGACMRNNVGVCVLYRTSQEFVISLFVDKEDKGSVFQQLMDRKKEVVKIA